MTTRAWTKQNIWGELERWYRLPLGVTPELLATLGADPHALAGAWESVLRAEVMVYGQRIWLSGHRGAPLLCASTSGHSPVIFAEIDARIERHVGPVLELHPLAEEELRADLGQRT